MNDARHVLDVTTRMHVIASTAEGQTLTLVEIERMAEQELAVEREEQARERCDA